MKKSLVAILTSLAICVASSGVYAESNSSKSGPNKEPQVSHKIDRHQKWCKSHPQARACHKYHRKHHRHHKHHYHNHDHDQIQRENGAMEERAMRHLQDHR